MIKIKEVNSFTVGKNFFATIHGNILKRTLKVWNYNKESEVLLENFIIPTIRAVKNKLWVYSKEKTFQWFIEDSLKTIKAAVEYSNFSPMSETEFLIIGSKKNNEGDRFITALEHSSLEQIWTKEFFSTFYSISNSTYYSVKFNENLTKTRIISLCITDGKEKWEYKLPEAYGNINNVGQHKKAEFIKILGVHRGIVWTCVNSGRLLGLDENTGKEFCYLPYPTLLHTDKKDIGVFGYNTMIDKEKEVVFSTTTHYFSEINLSNPLDSNILIDVSESCKKHQIELNNLVAWEGDHIYFYEGSDNNRFGIFSRSKKEIIWSGDIPEVKGMFPAIRKMDYANGRIFIQDHFNTLHIFEESNLKTSC